MLTASATAIVKPYSDWLSEDYHFVTVTPGELSAQDLLNQFGNEIAQIVRGEALPLSDSERQEVLQSRISYYPNDLLVVGWSAAFVYDSPAAAGPTLQLLEYANTQLLELRHYDELLTKVLAGVYIPWKSVVSSVAGDWRTKPNGSTPSSGHHRTDRASG